MKLVEEKTKDKINMIPIDKVKDIITKHDDLEKELSSGSYDLNYLQKNLKNILVLEALFLIAKNM